MCAISITITDKILFITVVTKMYLIMLQSFIHKPVVYKLLYEKLYIL